MPELWVEADSGNDDDSAAWYPISELTDPDSVLRVELALQQVNEGTTDE